MEFFKNKRNKKIFYFFTIICTLILFISITKTVQARFLTFNDPSSQDCPSDTGIVQNACYTYAKAIGIYNLDVEADGKTALSDDQDTAIYNELETMSQEFSDMSNNSANAANDLQEINDGYQQILTIAKTTDATVLSQSQQAQQGSCFGLSGFDVKQCFDSILSQTSYVFLQITSWVLWLCGAIFNLSITWGVIQMQQKFGSSSAINIGWADLRDIGNIAFIFMALYLGIQTIIGNDRYGNTKTLIRNLILAGLLVNFSLFFTKLLIDASNVLTISFYNILTSGNASGSGIADVFAKALGIQSLYNFQTTTGLLGWQSILITGIGGSLFQLFAGLTFLTAGALFFVRLVVLIFLMILSPIAFLAAAFPKLQEYAVDWWETLLGQLIFAPVYMILILFVSEIATGTLQITGGVQGAQALSAAFLSGNSGGSIASIANGDSITAILYFVLIIFLMNGATMIALKQASRGEGVIGKTVNKAMGWTQEKVTRVFQRPLGAATRGTVGRAAAAADNNLSNTAFGVSRFGRTLRSNTTGFVAKQKFGTEKSALDIQKENKTANEGFAKKIDTQVTQRTEKITQGVEKKIDRKLTKDERQKIVDDVRREEFAKLNKPTFANAFNKWTGIGYLFKGGLASDARKAAAKKLEDRLKGKGTREEELLDEIIKTRTEASASGSTSSAPAAKPAASTPPPAPKTP